MSSLDRDVFLISYYTARGNPTQKRAFEVNSLLNQYHKFLVTGAGRSKVQQLVDELGYKTPRKAFTPLQPKIQVGAGNDPNANDDFEPEKELVKAVDQTVKKANNVDAQKKYVSAEMDEIREMLKISIQAQAQQSERIKELSEQLETFNVTAGAIKKISAKQLSETMKQNPNNLNKQSWVVEKMTEGFKSLILTAPIKTFELAKAVAYYPTIYPLQVVTKFYSKKIAFVVGHIYYIIIGGVAYYIYIHASEDERAQKMCENDPNLFMCSSTERMFVYNAYQIASETGSIVGEQMGQIYSATFHIAGDGMYFMFQDLKDSLVNFAYAALGKAVTPSWWPWS